MSEFFHVLSLSSCQQDMYIVVCLESLVFVSEDPPLVLFFISSMLDVHCCPFVDSSRFRDKWFTANLLSSYVK